MSHKRQKSTGTTPDTKAQTRRAIRSQSRLAAEDFTPRDFTRMEARARREMDRAAARMGGAR